MRSLSWKLQLALACLGLGVAILCYRGLQLAAQRPRAPRPVATATAQPVVGVIPELSPVDVTDSIKERDFSCSAGADTNGDGVWIWDCERRAGATQFYVTLQSRSLNTVDYISASILQPSASADDIVASDFLGFIATMPYDGAKPSEARAWVEQGLPTLSGEQGDIRSTTIASVRYELFGPKTARTLSIGGAP